MLIYVFDKYHLFWDRGSTEYGLPNIRHIIYHSLPPEALRSKRKQQKIWVCIVNCLKELTSMFGVGIWSLDCTSLYTIPIWASASNCLTSLASLKLSSPVSIPNQKNRLERRSSLLPTDKICLIAPSFSADPLSSIEIIGHRPEMSYTKEKWHGQIITESGYPTEPVQYKR